MALLIPVSVLLAAGFIILSSISMHLFWLQLIWVVIGVGLVVLFAIVDWRSVFNHRWVSWALYLIAVVLLILVYARGPLIRNVRSWFAWGPFSFEPVEIAKVALIILYASYFSRRHIGIARWKNIFISLLFLLAPVVLTIIQPDLGSAVILFSIWFGFLLVSGLPIRRIVVTALILVLVGVAMWMYVLRGYQRARIIGFLYPGENYWGVNYSVTQSKIAVGSAGFWGKGYGQGSQLQLGFLTEPVSDFIFAAFMEEWGLLGGLVVILAFLALIYQVLKTGSLADRNFEKFICLGVAMMWGVHFLLNSGSELGLMPVVGVTFPFLSYGGSSMVTNFFLLSFIYGIRRNI